MVIIMKIIKKSLLVGAISTALVGCGNESFKPEVNTSNVAPVVSTNITKTINEKDAVSFAFLLGTPDGKKTGPGVVTDADGDPLSVKNLTADMDMLGFELEGNTMLLRPSALKDSLDTGETHTIVFSYEVSDGQMSTPRTATFNVIGEDFAPEVQGNIVAKAKRDVGSLTIDLLTRVSDKDGETLSADKVVAASTNQFAIPYTVENNQLMFDIASVESQVPDGQLLDFDFSYTVSDHRFDIKRNIKLSILGVEDIPGTPLIEEYFVNKAVNETDNLQIFDLLEGIVDREGDVISIVPDSIKMDGEIGLSYGAELESSNLHFNPNAYFTKIASGLSQDVVFTYKVTDDKGNVSDGERFLTVTVNGVETNLLKVGGASTDFEDGLTNGWTESNCGEGSGWGVSNTESVSGDNSLQITSNECFIKLNSDVVPDIQVNEKYYLSYWLNTDGTSPFISWNDGGPGDGGTGNFWAGDRPWHPGGNQWRPMTLAYDTDSAKLKSLLDVSTAVDIFIMSAYVEPNGKPYFDDFNVVRFSDIEGVDILKTTADFEDTTASVESTGGGTVEIKEVGGASVLFIDTTGIDASGVTPLAISLPIKHGAIQPNGKYAVTFDVQYVNYDTNKDTDNKTNQWGGFDIDFRVSTAAGGVDFTSRKTQWSGANLALQQYVVLNEASHYKGHNFDTDWSADDAVLTIEFSTYDKAQFIMDNVKIYAIP